VAMIANNSFRKTVRR